jgi:hypothetical protein
VLEKDKHVANYSSVKRVSCGTFFLGEKPPQNITPHGAHDFDSGGEIGSVSAASSTFSAHIGKQFKRVVNTLTLDSAARRGVLRPPSRPEHFNAPDVGRRRRRNSAARIRSRNCAGVSLGGAGFRRHKTRATPLPGPRRGVAFEGGRAKYSPGRVGVKSEYSRLGDGGKRRFLFAEHFENSAIIGLMVRQEKLARSSR